MPTTRRKAPVAKPRTGSKPERTVRDYRSTAIVVIVAIVASAACLFNQLTSDDFALIGADPRIRGMAGWGAIFSQAYWPPPYAPDLYRPLATSLLAIQYAIGGGDPLPFRLVSIALYVLACIGVLQLARRVFSDRTALAVAVLFAVHPVHVEVIALAVSQNESIVVFLTAASVAFYVDRRRRADGEIGVRGCLGLVLAYAVASLAKEDGFMLPAFLLAAEITLIEETSFRARLAKTGAGFAALGAAGIALILLRAEVLGGQIRPPVIAEALRGASPGGRALTMLQIVPEGLRLMFWPLHLRIDYGFREILPSTSIGPREMVGLVIVAAAVAIAFVARKRASAITFGLLWTAISLFPVSNLVLPTAIVLAERTLFLPSVGALIALGGTVDWLAARRWSWMRLDRKPALAVFALVVAAALTRVITRELVWRDAQTLLFTSVGDNAKSWRVWQGYGDVLFGLGRNSEAIDAYDRAIDLSLDTWSVRNRFGAHLRVIGQDSAAVDQFQKSLRQNPNQVIPLSQIPPALIAMGRYEEAKRIADSIIVVANAPPIMLWLRSVADSAIRTHAAAGSIRIGLRAP